MQGRVEIVVAHDVIGRLMIASTRQPMLSVLPSRCKVLKLTELTPPFVGNVLGQLVSFDGPEFYIKQWPGQWINHVAAAAHCSYQRSNVGVALVGLTFEEVLYAFPDAIPVGVEVERQY